MKKYYQIKPLEFEAIQCKYPDIMENLEEIDDFLLDTKYTVAVLPDKTVLILNEEISEPIGECHYFDYIVKDENKNVYIYSATQFKKLFTAIDNINYSELVKVSQEHLGFNVLVSIPYEHILKIYSNISLIEPFVKNLSKEIEYKIKKYFMEKVS